MPDDEWHYSKQGQTFPPVSWNVLVQMARGGKLSPTDQVWNERYPEWIAAASVEGLFYQSTSPKPSAFSGATSWLGGISLLMGIGMCLLEFVLIVIAGVLQAKTGGIDEESVEAVILGLFLLGGMGGAFIGGVLGLVAVFQPDTNKLTAAFGIALNGLCIVSVLGLMALGSMVE